MFLVLTLLGVIGLACSGPAEDHSDLPTTKALRCVVESLNATKTQGQGKSGCRDDVRFVAGLPPCEEVDRDFRFVKWFYEKRPHNDWVIHLATTTPSTTTSASTHATTAPDNTTETTTRQPEIYGAKKIVWKYCEPWGDAKGSDTYKFYMTFNEIWTDIQEITDAAEGQGWNPAHNEKEFCKLYNEKFLGSAKKTALTGLKDLGLMEPSGIDLANDVMDYLDRSVRLAYYVNHFKHFGNKPIPDQCGNRWFPKSVMDS